MKNWKVETTRVFGLENTLNSLSKQGYEIYSINTPNHVEFRIIAHKEVVKKTDTVDTALTDMVSQLKSVTQPAHESPEISKHKKGKHKKNK